MRAPAIVLVLLALVVGAHAEPEKPATPGVEVDKVAEGFRFTEGPAFDGKQTIYFTDIPNQRILRYDLETQKTEVFTDDSGRANGLMFDGMGRLHACEGGRRRLVRYEGGKVTVLAERFEGKRLNSPNDLAIDEAGGVYFTDPRYGKQDDRELDFEGVYYVSSEGKLTRMTTKAVKPNGILLSNDGKTLYVAASRQKRILAYDVKGPGVLENERVFAPLDPEHRGGPDGMTKDLDGNVYCAGQKRVWMWNPKGEVVDTFELPEGPANCVFVPRMLGGGWSLYATARTGFYRLTRKTSPDAWVSIGSVSSVCQMEATHIHNRLDRHGIESGIEGSLVYGVSVRYKHARQAIQLLSDDLAEQGLEFNLVQMYGRGTWPRKQVEPEVQRLDAPLAEVLKRDAFHADKALGTLLRSPTLADPLAKNQLVHSLEVRTFKYMESGGRWVPGYAVTLRFAREKGGKPTGRMGLQVFGDPWTVTCQGGSWSN